MAAQEAQNFKNHVKTNYTYYLGVVTVLLVNLVVTIVRFAHRPNGWHGWNIVVALALFMLALRARVFALRVQDRVIRLEERIRMAALMPLESRRLQAELTLGQIIALRFASDAELASLAEKAVQEKLTPKAIKEQIVDWRADHHRV